MNTRTWFVLLVLLLAPFASAQEPAQSSLFIVHFETGPSWNKALAPKDQAGFAGHSANMKRLRDEGIIVFGARYGDLGMVILSVATVEKAKALLDVDPGVTSGIFTYRVAPLRVFYPWKK